MNHISINDKINIALDRFEEGWTCSQVVLCSFNEDYSLDTNIAKAISCGFAGGMRCGETCGVIPAAIMIIGLWSLQQEEDIVKQKKLCFDTVSKFMHDFEKMQGKVKCRDILGYDIRNPEERKKYPGQQSKVCPQVIKDCIKVLACCINYKGDSGV